MENAPEHTAAVPAIRITNRLEPAACIPASKPTVLMRPSWMPKTNSRMRPLDSICLRFSSVGSMDTKETLNIRKMIHLTAKAVVPAHPCAHDIRTSCTAQRAQRFFLIRTHALLCVLCILGSATGTSLYRYCVFAVKDH